MQEKLDRFAIRFGERYMRILAIPDCTRDFNLLDILSEGGDFARLKEIGAVGPASLGAYQQNMAAAWQSYEQGVLPPAFLVWADFATSDPAEGRAIAAGLTELMREAGVSILAVPGDKDFPVVRSGFDAAARPRTAIAWKVEPVCSEALGRFIDDVDFCCRLEGARMDPRLAPLPPGDAPAICRSHRAARV